ncbi:unnamed protein product [Ectocarpus sp. CCAP 1310/34]|nr:unnamed protein product [Ectocarpus sp. CCAP 1310/34]
MRRYTDSERSAALLLLSVWARLPCPAYVFANESSANSVLRSCFDAVIYSKSTPIYGSCTTSLSSTRWPVRLELDDTPTSIARRDVTAFFSPQDCVNFLRFTQSQVSYAIAGSAVDPRVRPNCGFVVRGREALCVLLYRLAFPCRLKDMRLVFGMSESCICEAFNWMLHFLDFRWEYLLSLCW